MKLFRKVTGAVFAVLLAVTAFASTGLFADEIPDEWELFDEEEAEISDEDIELELAEIMAEEESTALLDQINSEGSIFNIECWDEEFKNRVIEHYPNYEVIDGSTGKIGEVTIKWHLTPEANNAYQNYLDSVLLSNTETAVDDRVDLFLAEDDFTRKYVNSDVTIPLSTLGIDDSELADQYEYTKQLATDEDGLIRAVTWQCWPGVLIYNRQAAIETWGTDDPEVVQTHVATWEAFMEAADDLAAKGYSITSSVYDTYPVYAASIETPWVSSDNRLSIRDSLTKWAENSKYLVSMGMTTTTDVWGENWYKGLMKDGKTFCCFGAGWMIEYGLGSDLTDSIAGSGGWGVCRGPQSFYSRGSWICAAAGTDNPTLAADIMRKMTTDVSILQAMLVQDGDFVNNRTVMETAKDDDRYTLGVLGGQNPIAVYAACAENIDVTNTSPYDIYCDDIYKEVMKDYFEGKITCEAAAAEFKKQTTDKYQELTAE